MGNPLSIQEGLAAWLALNKVGKKETTQKFYREIIATIEKQWGNTDERVDAVTDERLARFAQCVAHYAPSRWNAMVTALRSFLPGAKRLKYRKPRFRQFVPPTEAEFIGLLAEADKLKRSQAGIVIRFLAVTGLRISEARRVKWENVGSDKIEIPHGAKNGKARIIPLIPGASDVLQRLRQIRSDEFVLPRAAVRRGLEKACAKAGVTRMSYHCFRHLFATRSIESGVDVPTVARWLGHQDGGALASRMYFHLLDEHSRSMALRVKISV